MGERAVINASASQAELARISAEQRRIMFPLLEGELTGDERLVLDFGCGPGRFTAELAAMIDGRAVGVDPVARLLELAPRHPAVEYKAMSPGRIPLDDGAADVAWVCLVLGGITETRELEATAAEIERVLRPGGILLLAECTNRKQDVHHWRYRPVAAYQGLFRSVALEPRGAYAELDNTVSVLIGRRSGA